MIKPILILLVSLGLVGCATRLDLKLVTPSVKGSLKTPYLAPQHLKFMKNGRCIWKTQHPGSDSGPVDYETLGNYIQSNDTIYVEYIWGRSFGTIWRQSGYTIEDIDWEDIDKFSTIYLLNNTQDTVWRISQKGTRSEKFIISE